MQRGGSGSLAKRLGTGNQSRGGWGAVLVRALDILTTTYGWGFLRFGVLVGAEGSAPFNSSYIIKVIHNSSTMTITVSDRCSINH